MRTSFNLAKPVKFVLGNIETISKEGTIANGTKYLNYSKKIGPGYIHEISGVLEKQPGTNYFADVYSFIVRKKDFFTRNGVKHTTIEKLTNGKGSSTTYMENGIRTLKHTYDADCRLLKTIVYDEKGLPKEEIKVFSNL